MDYKYVNIYNEGIIPWLNKKGPIFGLKIAPGVYSLLSKDPRISMRVTNQYEAESERKKYEERFIQPEVKNPQDTKKDTIKLASIEETKINDIKEEIPSLTETVISDDDDELDKIDTDNIDTSFSNNIVLEKIEDSLENENATKYTKKKLEVMTKAELKAILRERGYLEGPNAGKYHDTHDKLIEKVLRTQ